MYEIFGKKEDFLENDFYKEVLLSGFTFFDDMHSNPIKKYSRKTNITDEIIMHFMSSVWDNTLVIGIDNIDNQHKEMFNLTGQLLNSMKENGDKNETIKILNHLNEYMNRHFKEEEAIQKQYKYPKYKLEIKEHKKFRSGLDEIRDILKQGNISPLVTITMYQKIFGCYRKHMLNLDKDFGEFLLNKIRL